MMTDEEQTIEAANDAPAKKTRAKKTVYREIPQSEVNAEVMPSTEETAQDDAALAIVPVEAIQSEPVSEEVAVSEARATPKRKKKQLEPAAESLSDEAVDGAVTDSPSDAEEGSDELAIDVATMEALLFGTHSPLTAGRIAELLGLPTTKPIRRAIKELNHRYESSGRCFRVEQVAGGFQLLTLPQYGEILKRLHQKEIDAKLTKAALETLAMIAYKQPMLRADLEAIRGVASGETIRSLMEKHLVKIAGRAELPGRPILYGTTKRFLELFGLNTLKDLPQGENGMPVLPG